MSTNQNDHHIQQAIAFLQAQSLERILVLAHKAYEKKGLDTMLHLVECSQQEHLGIASLFDQPARVTGPRHISLVAWDRLLRESEYHCGLKDVFALLFPEGPPTKERWQIENLVNQFQEELLTLCTPDSLASQWLRQGTHGLPWLTRRYKKILLSSPAERHLLFEHLRLLLTAIEALPVVDVDLAIFANQWYGNPHALETNCDAGRVFFAALSDLFALQPGFSVFASQNLSEAMHRKEAIYDTFGLRFTELSSLVFISGPLHIQYADRAIVLDTSDIHPFSLASQRYWQDCQLCTNRVYIIENLTVFNALHRQCEHFSCKPIMICGAGWPSRAVRTFLHSIVRTHATTQLFYSGDFDLEGLRICHAFTQWYPQNCTLWHMDVCSYQRAVPANRQPIAPWAQKALRSLPESFQQLVDTMLTTNSYAYQEGLLPLLFEDIYQHDIP